MLLDIRETDRREREIAKGEGGERMVESGRVKKKDEERERLKGQGSMIRL